MSTELPILDGLAPVLDTSVEILVLGSFPSPTSLNGQHYYAHRQNHFWPIMAAILGEPLTDLDYPAKLATLLAHRIGLWDVYRSCKRKGALDSAIQSPETNDFSLLKKNAPQLRRVCFNGKTSGKFEAWFVEEGYQTFVLPSTSPAYTLPYPEKLARWCAAFAAHPFSPPG